MSLNRAQISLGVIGCICLGSSLVSSGSRAASGPSLVLELITLLKNSPRGAELVLKAEKIWNIKNPQAWGAKIKWGEVSRTDAVLTRSFDPETNKEERVRNVTVYLNRKQDINDIALDFAHELTHATSPAQWDPYDPELDKVKYILSSIEGAGGEVDALMNECQVALDLKMEELRCERYVKSGKIDRKAIKSDFYKVGTWKKWIQKNLTDADFESLTLISDDDPKLFSSTGGTPYPAALIKEYQTLNSAACENSKRRILASTQSSKSNEFLIKRCSDSR